MNIRNLNKIKAPYDIAELKKLVASFTIFEKIEFTGIKKETLRERIKYLREVQVPGRTVLLDTPDETVVFYWFKNWLHTMLKNYVARTPTDKRGCSEKVVIHDMSIDIIWYYENGQQNFKYTLAEIEEYINS